MALSLPEPFVHGGSIVRRQTTYWDVVSQRDQTCWRATFVHKAEFCYVGVAFDDAALVEHHPVLYDHVEPIDSLFISSPAADPDKVLLDLGALAEQHFAGWRPIDRYLNSGYSPRNLLVEGSGVLLAGPRSFVEACAALLVRSGVRVDEPTYGVGPRGHVEALLLGRNFVVAQRFSFERIGDPTRTPS